MSSKRGLAAALAVACSLLLVHLLHRARQPISFDDAFMFLRYAKQFLAGHGHAWNPDGKQVFGVTGTLHLAVVTLFAALPLVSDETVLLLASLAFTALALAAIAWVCVSLLRSPLREDPWLVALGVWLFLLPQRLFINPALSGMDSMSALFANCLVGGAALWLARSGNRRALLASAGAALLAILARPDDGLYAVLCPLLAVAIAGPRPRLPLLGRLAASLALVLAGYAAVATGVFGDPLPLPFYAKSLGYFTEYLGARYWNPFQYLGQILSMWMPVLLTITFGASRRTAPELVALLAPVALTFGYYFSVVQIMGIDARYYVPATPFAILSAIIVIDDLWASGDVAGELSRAMRTRWPLALLLVAAFPTLLHDAETAYHPDPATHDPAFPSACYERPEQGLLPKVDYESTIEELSGLARTLPLGARIALSEHGRIGAAAPQVSLDDLIALHDPQFAHHGFDPAMELARKPDAIWMPHYYYVPLWHGLMTEPRLWEEYEVWPDALNYGFAIRRDSPYHDALRSGFARIWKRLYPDRDMEAWRAIRLRSELSQCRRESRGPGAESPGKAPS
jgi:hypothetical protein